MFRWAGEPELAEGRVFLYGGEVRTLAAREKNKNWGPRSLCLSGRSA